jgi:hypothetical protein
MFCKKWTSKEMVIEFRFESNIMNKIGYETSCRIGCKTRCRNRCKNECRTK